MITALLVLFAAHVFCAFLVVLIVVRSEASRTRNGRADLAPGGSRQPPSPGGSSAASRTQLE